MGAPWRIGKAFDTGWAVFRIEQRRLIEFRVVAQRFSTFEQARAAFAKGGAA